MPAAIAMVLSAGLTSALLYASVLGGTFGALILILLSPLPLYFVGLGRGTYAALGAGAIATMIIGIAIGSFAALNFGAANAVPAILLVRQAGLRRQRSDGTVEWYPAGRLMLALGLYASIAFIAVLIGFSGSTGGLAAFLAREFAEMQAGFGVTSPGPAEQPIVAAVVAIIPGLAGSSWLLVTAGNALLAQGLLVRFGRNMRPSPRLDSYALPAWLAAATALALGVGIFGTATLGYAGLNLAIILLTPFAFAGLALVHLLAKRGGAQAPFFVMLYIVLGMTLLALSWLLVLGLAGLGVVDQLAHLRQRLARPGFGPRSDRE